MMEPGPPAPRPRPIWGMLIVIALAGVSIASAGVSWLLWQRAQRVSADLSRATQDRSGLQQASEELQKRWETLQTQIGELTDEQAKLQKQLAAVTQDRDNLRVDLADAKQELGKQGQAGPERDLLENLLKKSAEEQRALREQLAQLEEQVVTLEDAHNQLLTERDAYRQELETVKTGEAAKQLKRLKEDVSANAKELGEVRRQLKMKSGQLAETKRREDKLIGRLQKLQKDYTSAVHEGNQLKRKMKTAPSEMTRLAQQHERLVKENATMHYNLGILFVQGKEYAAAAEEFKKVIELRPDDAEAYYNLGVIYSEHLPDKERSFDHFRRYLELNPSGHDANWVKQYLASWQAWEAKERLE